MGSFLGTFFEKKVPNLQKTFEKIFEGLVVVCYIKLKMIKQKCAYFLSGYKILFRRGGRNHLKRRSFL
ncbi:MAG: hypothetical protein J6R82_05380, partial [Clostridia bacterium]|nr:hypothetical protein [Clostridia bacterium]